MAAFASWRVALYVPRPLSRPAGVILADISREIEEELRQERFEALWRKHGRKLIGLAVLVVIATAIFVAWQDWQRRQDEELGGRFAAIMASAALGKTPDDKIRTEKDLDALSDSGAGGYRLLARFQAALMRIQGADREAGIGGLKAIAADGHVDQSFRDLALALAGLAGVDNEDASAVSSALAPLSVAPDAWRFSAQELVALADWKAGDHAAARKFINSLPMMRMRRGRCGHAPRKLSMRSIIRDNGAVRIFRFVFGLLGLSLLVSAWPRATPRRNCQASEFPCWSWKNR